MARKRRQTSFATGCPLPELLTVKCFIMQRQPEMSSDNKLHFEIAQQRRIRWIVKQNNGFDFLDRRI
jgi:hypothetical protein